MICLVVDQKRCNNIYLRRWHVVCQRTTETHTKSITAKNHNRSRRKIWQTDTTTLEWNRIARLRSENGKVHEQNTFTFKRYRLKPWKGLNNMNALLGKWWAQKANLWTAKPSFIFNIRHIQFPSHFYFAHPDQWHPFNCNPQHRQKASNLHHFSSLL